MQARSSALSPAQGDWWGMRPIITASRTVKSKLCGASCARTETWAANSRAVMSRMSRWFSSTQPASGRNTR